MNIKPTPKVKLGDNIKNIIEEKNLRRVDIIREMQLSGISITKQRLYRIEHNIVSITADEMLMLAKILKCDISDFFQENG